MRSLCCPLSCFKPTRYLIAYSVFCVYAMCALTLQMLCVCVCVPWHIPQVCCTQIQYTTYYCVYWNTSLWVFCFKSSMCIQCAMCHAILSIQNIHACMHEWEHVVCSTGERRSISSSCLPLCIFKKTERERERERNWWRANTYRSRCLRTWCVPASNMLSYVLCLCVLFFLYSVVLHIFLLFLLHCLMCLPVVRFFILCEWIESVFSKKPNRIDASVLFDNKKKRAKKKPNNIKLINT